MIVFRRGYTAARYQRIIDNIRRHMPNASVSGDAIVGFPGETEEQFQATCRCDPVGELVLQGKEKIFRKR